MVSDENKFQLRQISSRRMKAEAEAKVDLDKLLFSFSDKNYHVAEFNYFIKYF